MFILQTKYLHHELRRTEAAQFYFDKGLICSKPGDLHSAGTAHNHIQRYSVNTATKTYKCTQCTCSFMDARAFAGMNT